MTASQGEPPASDGQDDGADPEVTLKLQRGAGESTVARRPDAIPPESAGLPVIPGLRIDGRLGAGAMGDVYAGCQEYLGRDVAVKVLGPRCVGETYQSRFKREAILLAGLTHENIVACFDAGIAPDGRCYLVMERVNGPTLSTWIKEHGALSAKAALRVTLELAKALQHAHRSCAIIHRDVKPANVLLAPMEGDCDDGLPFVAKLADLGLARPVDAESVDMALTADGVILGTPSTMAPEQFDNPTGVDRRADIYALGCVLFESLTGHAAFRGRGLAQIVQEKTAARGPDARSSGANIPGKLAELASRMMSARLGGRPQTYQELLQQCEAIHLGEEGGSVSAVRRFWWAPLIVGGAALVFLWFGLKGSGAQSVPGKTRIAAEESDRGEQPAKAGDPTERERLPVAPGLSETAEPSPTSVSELPVVPPPVIDLPARVDVQSSDAVELSATVAGLGYDGLQYEWSWETTEPFQPTGQTTNKLEFVAPPVQQPTALNFGLKVIYGTDDEALELASTVMVYPSAEPLESELPLVVPADYGDQPRHWTHWEGGMQFGQLSADEGLFCRNKTKRTVNGIALPGGAWTFTGLLAVSEGETAPASLGLVIDFPHGRRYELSILAPAGPGAVLVSFERSSSDDPWLARGEPRDLGTVGLGAVGLPVTVSWGKGELILSAGARSVAIREPVAPAGLGFFVEAGTGELREPKLLPR